MPAALEKAGFKELAMEARCVGLMSRLQAAETMSREDLVKSLGEVKTVLAGMGPSQLRSAWRSAPPSSPSAWAAKDLAIQLYGCAAELLTATKNEKAARQAAKMQGAVRRLGLRGKEIELTGKLVDGKAFDWSKYKGKLAPIDFFASWCPPCRKEMPAIAKLYEAYHGRGFDVVGISIDHNLDDLEKFLQGNKHPWAVIADVGQAHENEDSPSVRYGVFSIPQTILVGRDGKVVSLDVHGEQLDKLLEDLIGPAELPGPEKPAGAETPAKAEKPATKPANAEKP